jgi:hypothetical protein
MFVFQNSFAFFDLNLNVIINFECNESEKQDKQLKENSSEAS